MNAVVSKPFAALVRASWEATVGERFRFFLFVFLYVSAYSLDLVIPWALAYTLDSFVRYGFTDQGFQYGLRGVIAFMLLRFAYTFLHHSGRYVQARVAYSARMHTLQKVFSAFFAFPLSWHASRHSGENLSKLHRSAGAIDGVIGTYVWQVIEGLVKVVLASIAIFTLDFWVAMNVLVMGLVTIGIMILFNRVLTERYRQNNTFANKINRICIDYLFNIVTVKTLGLEQSARSYLASQQAEGLGYARKISKYIELKWGTTAIGYGLVIGTSLLIYFYGHRGSTETFDVAKVYVLLNYLDKIFQAIGSFTGYYGGFLEAATAYDDGAQILQDLKSLPVHVKSQGVRADWKEIRVENLNFFYSRGGRGLRNMNVSIKRKDKIALVGPSGGGKSTLLKLLAGVLMPESAAVSTDLQLGLTIQDVSKIALLVPQEPEIFSESFRYNLTMGENFSDEDINFFIKLGRLEAVLGKLPHGTETDLAEKGLNLSVGEKQRVAMVRGLLRVRSRDLLLLDEPTSSLDPLTEKEIFLGLLSHFSDRVIITACHRLNLVPIFDKVIFIRDGSIEEIGSFAELLENKGPFARAWEDYQRKVPKETEPE